MTPEDALAHPTWSMGPKITIDSATLANKGLELIEAHFLFGLGYDAIEVAVHPTSVVHAIVRLRDGACLAHLGYPDMRVPISFALTYPDREPTPLAQLDLRPGSTSSSTRRISTRFRCSGSRGRRASAPAPSRARSTPRTRPRCRRSSRAGSASSTSTAPSRTCSRAWTASPARDLDDLIEADRSARSLVTVRA